MARKSSPQVSSNAEHSAGEWIPVIDAVQMLAPHVGGEKAAKEAISERLRECALDASPLWTSHGPDVGAVLSTRPTASESTIGPGFAKSVSPENPPGKIKLSIGFWTYSQDWYRDVGRWQWRDGLFIVSSPPALPPEFKGKNVPFLAKIGTRHVAFGVHVRRGQIEDLAGLLAHQAKQRSNAGAKPLDLWAEWVAELVLLEHEGLINLPMTADKLLGKVANRLAERGIEGPSRSRTYPVAKATIEALRDRGNLLFD